MLHNIEWLLTIKDKLKLIFLNFSTSLVNIYFLTKLIISQVERSINIIMGRVVSISRKDLIVKSFFLINCLYYIVIYSWPYRR